MPKQLRLKGYEFGDRWLDSLTLAASECSKHRRLKLFSVTFLSELPAPKVLEACDWPIRLSKRSDYWVAFLSTNDKRKTIQNQFAVFKSGPNAWTLFTPTETIATEDRLLRLLRAQSPDFSTAFLSSAEIRNMFERLEETKGAEVFVNKAVAYSHRREGEISFKKQAYHAVFNRADNEGMFIDKVDFTLRGSPFLHAFVARNGVAKFIDGDIQVFLENILNSIVETASGNHRVFRESSRKPGEVLVSPVDIDFGQTVFEDRNDNLEFLSALDLMSRSGIAILHENPYVHVSLIDFFDGSSFDIFATVPSAVTIIPQVGASAFSLNRLCNHIYENFREGKIVKPERRRWTLDDVLT